MWRRPVVLLLLLACCGSHEARVHDGSVGNVETVRREVRETLPLVFATEAEDLLGEGNSPGKQQAPEKIVKNSSGKSDEGGYYKTYGNDAEGEKGYLQATYSKGNHGYKTLDTFHKRDGDKYAFEKHVAYGKARADKESSHNDEAASHSSKAGDHETAGTVVHAHYESDEDENNGSNEHTEASDHESYTAEDGDHSTAEDGDHSAAADGDHSAAEDGEHYTDHGPESSSYEHSGGYENADGGQGSYESRSSYSKSSGGDHEDEGSHYY